MPPGQAPPDPASTSPDLGSALDEALRASQQAEAKATARQFLKNPHPEFSSLHEGEIRVVPMSVPKKKWNCETKLPFEISARVVGLGNGMLYTGVVGAVVTGPVENSPGQWWVTTDPAPMLHVDGSTAGTLPSRKLTVLIQGGPTVSTRR